MSTVLAESPAIRGPYRDYSPEFKAEVLAALDANNGNVQATANEYDINESTLRGWVALKDVYRELREQKAIEISDLAEYNARKLAVNIASTDLSNVPLNQQAMAFGVMVDKMQLLRNLPTSISLSVDREDILSFLSDSLSDVIDVTPEQSKS